MGSTELFPNICITTFVFIEMEENKTSIPKLLLFLINAYQKKGKYSRYYLNQTEKYPNEAKSLSR